MNVKTRFETLKTKINAVDMEDTRSKKEALEDRLAKDGQRLTKHGKHRLFCENRKRSNKIMRIIMNLRKEITDQQRLKEDVTTLTKFERRRIVALEVKLTNQILKRSIRLGFFDTESIQ